MAVRAAKMKRSLLVPRSVSEKLAGGAAWKNKEKPNNLPPKKHGGKDEKPRWGISIEIILFTCKLVATDTYTRGRFVER